MSKKFFIAIAAMAACLLFFPSMVSALAVDDEQNARLDALSKAAASMNAEIRKLAAGMQKIEAEFNAMKQAEATDAKGNTAAADESEVSKISMKASVLYTSKYVARGFACSEGSAIQQSFSAGYRDFTLTLWTNLDLASNRLTELDLSLDYGFKLGILSLNGGYTYYTFPHFATGNRTQEFYAGLTVDTFLSPALFVYYDFDLAQGTYVSLAAGHKLDVGKAVFNLTAALGFNCKQFRENIGFSELTVGITADVPVSERLYVQLFVKYSISLDTSEFENHFFGGISANITIE